MDSIIMIVDDMKLNIEMLAEILDDRYIVMPATSGENAMKLLERRKPDLMLLDVSMPGVDGFGVLRFMKEHEEFSNIPVIFVTGEHDTEVEKKGLALGAVDYVKKPYVADIIRVKVRNHLEFKAYRDNLELLVRERTEQLEKRTMQLAASREAIIMGMSLMSESHDSVTGSHVKRIKSYTKILTLKMRELYPDMVTEDLAEKIVLFSPLHDVGKVGISDTILRKTGVLTPEEYDIMKMHTVGGAELLRKTEGFFLDNNDENDLSVAIEIAECHHERFDGTGYPHGLTGGDIPLSARIVALVDVYDALRSPRPYKKALTHEDAIDIIFSGDAKTNPQHFDPKVLSVLGTVHPEFKNYADSIM